MLQRLSRSIREFVELVESQFGQHPLLPCHVSMADNPRVREAWQRVGRLRHDAGALMYRTIDSFGTLAPVLLEPLTVSRVARPKTGTLLRRSIHLAELMGWFTPNEARLDGALKLTGPAVLEERGAVLAGQRGFVQVRDAKGNARIEEWPVLAESDNSISNRLPLLTQKSLSHYQMAVGEASLELLKTRARRLLTWRPHRVRTRVLDPNWAMHGQSLATIIQAERRRPTGPTPAVGNRDPLQLTAPEPTQRELRLALDDRTANSPEMSASAFRVLAQDAGIQGRKKGRRYSPDEVRALIDAATRNGKPDRMRIALAWAKWATPVR